VEREIERRRPGDEMTITVLRGDDRIDLRAKLGDEPKLAREAERKFFEHLGLTIREFVYADAVARRVKTSDAAGVVVFYVKANNPAAMSGLEVDDWIKEIDGAPIHSFADAAAKLAAINADPARTEFVLLVSRGADTTVLRVKLR